MFSCEQAQGAGVPYSTEGLLTALSSKVLYEDLSNRYF